MQVIEFSWEHGGSQTELALAREQLFHRQSLEQESTILRETNLQSLASSCHIVMEAMQEHLHWVVQMGHLASHPLTRTMCLLVSSERQLQMALALSGF